MHALRFPLPARAGVVAATLALAAGAAQAQVRVDVTNLVSDDQTAHAGKITDAGLVNAWGLSYSPTSPFWVSANGTDTATLYSVDPLTQATAKLGLTVSVPVGGVTGQVFNSAAPARSTATTSSSSARAARSPAGAARSGRTPRCCSCPRPDDVYKGAAFATLSGNSYLYAANFRTGAIDILKGASGAPDLAGNFTDPGLPSGYAPFNIQNLDGTLYVTYALQDASKHDEVAGAGLGFVSSFDPQGNFIARVASAGVLDAPWGLAIAPTSFGALAGSLLVGNFGDGRISAFDPTSHALLGQLAALDGTPLAIDGLWGLAPGNGGSGGNSALLYFSAGPDDEMHGVFGVLAPVAAVPESSSLWLLAAGLVAVGAFTRRRRAA